ncbi:hypothetical protein [Candidatus Liberibacter americanus]|uniref:Lipoprotein n=1 Tax=Candidatus Liberibacter americanus str. Sao Paulo TaxID=1261131 RepID=U6B698_9HYPH|nr:hypothetical protein [Candidatus Liberibacter americanus]AHA28299.1 hypothetical protein lam_969 [Candidatus Liberibacter americanus str. Sao Paulo]EMS36591.1 hypothetical protein G653_00050 [Candidatus Liberibacter americanus PW_SP]
MKVENNLYKALLTVISAALASCDNVSSPENKRSNQTLSIKESIATEKLLNDIKEKSNTPKEKNLITSLVDTTNKLIDTCSDAINAKETICNKVENIINTIKNTDSELINEKENSDYEYQNDDNTNSIKQNNDSELTN